MTYQLTKHDSIIRLADGAFIPADPANADYAEYLEWRDAGNVPLPADPDPVTIVTSVTMRQARLALLQAGLLTLVEDSVAAMPGVEGEAARIEWEYAAVVERNSNLIAGLSASLGLAEEQLDNLFILAASL